MSNLDDYEVEHKKEIMICGMLAKVMKITHKTTRNVRYTCRLPLTASGTTMTSARKELEFLMTLVQRNRNRKEK